MTPLASGMPNRQGRNPFLLSVMEITHFAQLTHGYLSSEHWMLEGAIADSHEVGDA
jgi:hypothetical protein